MASDWPGLDARGDIRRVAHREPFGAIAPPTSPTIATPVYADAHGQRHRTFMQARVSLATASRISIRLHRAPSIVFMRNGIAEAHKDAVAVELRDGAFVAADSARRRIAIVRDDFPRSSASIACDSSVDLTRSQNMNVMCRRSIAAVTQVPPLVAASARRNCRTGVR
jgi:hypothetical protein